MKNFYFSEGMNSQDFSNQTGTKHSVMLMRSFLFSLRNTFQLYDIALLVWKREVWAYFPQDFERIISHQKVGIDFST